MKWLWLSDKNGWLGKEKKIGRVVVGSLGVIVPVNAHLNYSSVRKKTRGRWCGYLRYYGETASGNPLEAKKCSQAFYFRIGHE